MRVVLDGSRLVENQADLADPVPGAQARDERRVWCRLVEAYVERTALHQIRFGARLSRAIPFDVAGSVSTPPGSASTLADYSFDPSRKSVAKRASAGSAELR